MNLTVGPMEFEHCLPWILAVGVTDLIPDWTSSYIQAPMIAPAARKSISTTGILTAKSLQGLRTQPCRVTRQASSSRPASQCHRAPQRVLY